MKIAADLLPDSHKSKYGDYRLTFLVSSFVREMDIRMHIDNRFGSRY